MPSTKKWTDKNFSSTHAIILFMFEQLQVKDFTCRLENLYISAKFFRAALILDQKILLTVFVEMAIGVYQNIFIYRRK